MNNDDDLYDDYDYEYEEGVGGEVEEVKPAANRTFIVSLGVVAIIFLISLVALAVVAAIILPQNRIKRENQQAVIYAMNTATAYAATQANLIAPPRLSTVVQPTALPEQPTNTPVAIVATVVPQAFALGGGLDGRTATVAALLTQAARSGVTAAPAATYPVVYASQLANAGFADEVGLPLLIGGAVILVIIIILARRMRTAKAKQ
jgi:hypothetical protein